MNQPVIKIESLSKSYKGFLWKKNVDALVDLNLQIPKKCVFGFLGPNGAGKTTTIKLLMDLLKPTRGQA
ncbi:MAG: ATP-binding cassette domain-containing protein [Verrucomicrobiota bacterium]|nr:ATP-binding cassette domain-containing protein [Verrucomicrobiota bacterium]